MHSRYPPRLHRYPQHQHARNQETKRNSDRLRSSSPPMRLLRVRTTHQRCMRRHRSLCPRGHHCHPVHLPHCLDKLHGRRPVHQRRRVPPRVESTRGTLNLMAITVVDLCRRCKCPHKATKALLHPTLHPFQCPIPCIRSPQIILPRTSCQHLRLPSASVPSV